MQDLVKNSIKQNSGLLGKDFFVKIKKQKRLCVYLLASGAVLLFAGFLVTGLSSVSKLISVAEQTDDEIINLTASPVAATSEQKDLISIPAGVVKAHPFLPARHKNDEIEQNTLVMDVPKFDLVDPPDMVGENPAAAQIMNTVVSGILYDKFSPSAILNIDGSDYLVKKGDVIRNYKVLSITQNSVTVQLGANTYKAGIGELLTDGSVNYNEVSNLSRKFGGDQQ